MKSSNYVVEHALSFSEVGFIPEVYIFLDDTIYKGALDVIKNSKFMQQVKIITHSNEDIEFPDNVCRITFNLDEVAQKSSELMMSLLNREQLLDYVLPINPIQDKIPPMTATGKSFLLTNGNVKNAGIIDNI